MTSVKNDDDDTENVSFIGSPSDLEEDLQEFGAVYVRHEREELFKATDPQEKWKLIDKINIKLSQLHEDTKHQDLRSACEARDTRAHSVVLASILQNVMSTREEVDMFYDFRIVFWDGRWMDERRTYHMYIRTWQRKIS